MNYETSNSGKAFTTAAWTESLQLTTRNEPNDSKIRSATTCLRQTTTEAEDEEIYGPDDSLQRINNKHHEAIKQREPRRPSRRGWMMTKTG